MHLSPNEVARRFGVSIKALRLYERRGLLTPLRSEAGWRTYGPDQIARLHQILALKRMGLSLVRIGEVLAAGAMLEPVLALQEDLLTRDAARLARALRLVQTARRRLAHGEALSIDDLETLHKETVMTPKPDPEEIKTLTEAYARKHLSPEEMDRMARYASPDAIADWHAVIADAKAAAALSDPASSAALEVARRWRRVVRQLSGGDASLEAKGRAAWMEALADPRVAASMALTPDVMDFVKQAQTNLPD